MHSGFGTDTFNQNLLKWSFIMKYHNSCDTTIATRLRCRYTIFRSIIPHCTPCKRDNACDMQIVHNTLDAFSGAANELCCLRNAAGKRDPAAQGC